MLRSQKFKKQVGFIRSHSSKGLDTMQNPSISDSQEFSSFEYVHQTQTGHNSDQQFSPYKQPQFQTKFSSTNYPFQYPRQHSRPKNNYQSSSNKEFEKMKYPPRRNDSKKEHSHFSNNNEQKKIALRNKDNKKYDLPRRVQIAEKQEGPVTFSNQRLRGNYKLNAQQLSREAEKPSDLNLEELNRICQRIGNLKTDYQFDTQGNIIRHQNGEKFRSHAQKSQSKNKKHEENEKLQTSPKHSPGRVGQKQSSHYRKTQPYQFQQEFSLGDPNSPSKRRPSQPTYPGKQIPGCHNPQHRLLMKPNSKVIEDQSSISQQQDQENSLGHHQKQQRQNKERPVGMIKTSPVHPPKTRELQARRQEYSDENQEQTQQESLITSYKVAQFTKKNKGIRQEVLQMQRDRSAKQQQFSQNKKTITEQGYQQARGGICFELDTKQFTMPVPSSNHNPDRYQDQNHNSGNNNYQLYGDDNGGEYLMTKKRTTHNLRTTNMPKPKKKKEVNMKEELLKRRRMARNYDQMARKKLFN